MGLHHNMLLEYNISHYSSYFKTKKSHDMEDHILFLCYCKNLRSHVDVYLQ
jgi:hypothetical protein